MPVVTIFTKSFVTGHIFIKCSLQYLENALVIFSNIKLSKNLIKNKI